MRGVLHDCMREWYVPGIDIRPFQWMGWGNGSSGSVSMLEWLGGEEDHAVAIFDFRYDLSRHGFSSSLDDLPLGTSFSSISFSMNPQYMGITLDEWASGVMAKGTASLASARLDFVLAGPVVLTERPDSKALFLSSFANAYGGWGEYGEGQYIDHLGTWANLSGFHADVLKVVPIPQPPALPLLLGGLAGLGWMARRSGSRTAVG